MIVLYNWLKEFVDFDLDVNTLCKNLTMQGLEIEEIKHYGKKVDGLVVGEIKEISKVPKSDKLSLTKVFDGNNTFNVICGAPNVKQGQKICFAPVGVKLPIGLTIKKRKIRGIESEGMICSKEELGLEEKSEGIWELDVSAVPGDNMDKYFPEEDYIITLAITANRGDALGHLGVAREIAAMEKKTLKHPDITFEENKDIERPKISIVDADLGPRYSSRIVKGVSVKESPKWLQESLIKLGLRPINNIVDITNYVLYELGHPLHAFDLHKLEGEQIIVRRAKKNEKMHTLDDVERVFDDEMLVIADKNKAVAVAGVMGGANSEVSEETIDVLLESAYFLPRSVRRTSKNLGLSTDASYRFERGTDYETAVEALNRTAKLIKEIAGGEVSELVDVYPNKMEKAKIKISREFVEEKLGVPLSDDEINDILTCLEFDVKKHKGSKFDLVVPSCKTDVLRPIDVVEEIARIYHYDRIPKKVFPVVINEALLDTNSSLKDKIKNTLTSLGLYEVYNFAFSPVKKELDKLGIDTTNYLIIQNPYSVEQETLKETLLPNLIHNVEFNINHGNKNLAFFEIGKVFAKKGRKHIENTHLGIILYGECESKSIYNSKGRDYDFFDLKGILEEIFETINIKKHSLKAIEKHPFMHPNKSANIFVDNKEIGVIGEMHPEKVGLFKFQSVPIMLELDLIALIESKKREKSYQEISKFPAVYRDLAVVVKEEIENETIIKTINKTTKYIKTINLVDIYKGKQIEEGYKSLAYSLLFQDTKSTLSDELVNQEFSKILKNIEKSCGGKIRES